MAGVCWSRRESVGGMVRERGGAWDPGLWSRPSWDLDLPPSEMGRAEGFEERSDLVVWKVGRTQGEPSRDDLASRCWHQSGSSGGGEK